ncbi:MAG: lytic transglycosylase domain-containing protein [Eubacteriales bacterium]|nr:lytic transglycosylase domain-containing protein [Eubacteriales bacterium]
MAINIIDPNLTSYLKTISSSTALGQATSSGNNFSQLLSAVLGGIPQTSVDLDGIFQKAADTYGVPVELLKAVGKAESNFDPTAKSSAGAMGIMQLMPGTAESLGVTDAFDPYQNIMGGANYLSQMLSQVNGDVEIALAAYNAGPGNVEKYGGIPPFEETQNYIQKVMDYASEQLVAGIVPANAATAGSESLSGVTAKDLSTMMTLYRYQTELSILSALTDNKDNNDSTSELFSDELMNLI